MSKKENPLLAVQMGDLDSITVDEDGLTVTALLLTSEHGEFSEYTDVTTLEDLPIGVREAMAALSRAVVSMLRERAAKPPPARCGTCRSACCYNEGAIRVTPEDLTRLREVGSLDDIVDYYPERSKGGTDWQGYAGQLKMKRVARGLNPDAHAEGVDGCMFVDRQGCTIYEHRPTVCREYSAHTCGDTYVEDPAKVEAQKKGKRTLRIVRG